MHHPGPFEDNYTAYKDVLERHKLKHMIFFARKANKCRFFVKEASRLGFGVDTASYRELKQSLDVGCKPERLVLTAAVKNERLLNLALHHDVQIILDNEDECRMVNRLAGELGKTPQTGIRVSGFHYGGEKLYSRFGFDIDDVAGFIVRSMGPGREFGNLRYNGFHFHLNGYSIKQRGEALVQTIRQADALLKHDISTSFIDIGGGLLTGYLSDGIEWENFWNELKKAVRGERDPVTFGNDGLGYEMVNGELHGIPDVYPYYNETPKARFLEKILSYQDGSGQTAASLMRERDIEFRMEPGRSLVDQAGMTVAKVVYRKKDHHGTWLVGLEMNRSQLCSSSADFLLDPVLIFRKELVSGEAGEESVSREEPVTGGKPVSGEEPVSVYFTGAYCLEQDIILKRKIQLPRLPEVGDIIVFPNTAGYMMHFYETEAHLFELAANLVCDSASGLSFIPDEDWIV